MQLPKYARQFCANPMSEPSQIRGRNPPNSLDLPLAASLRPTNNSIRSLTAEQNFIITYATILKWKLFIKWKKIICTYYIKNTRIIVKTSHMYKTGLKFLQLFQIHKTCIKLTYNYNDQLVNYGSVQY